MNIWHWLIVLAVVVLTFGTKLLGSAGSDIESAILHFKKAVLNPKPRTPTPVWLKVAAGSVLFMGLLKIAERLIAR